MTLEDFAYEFDSLSGERKVEGLNKLFQTLISNMGNHSALIDDILQLCSAWEADDEFGTEGLDV